MIKRSYIRSVVDGEKSGYCPDQEFSLMTSLGNNLVLAYAVFLYTKQ